MKELIELISDLVREPHRWAQDRIFLEHRLQEILDSYADQRPKTLDELVAALKADYPFLEDNMALVEMGEQLRADLLAYLKPKEPPPPAEGEDPPVEGFTVDGAKAWESRLALFNKLMDHNNRLAELIGTVAGNRRKTTSKGKVQREVTDSPGMAQRLLQK